MTFVWRGAGIVVPVITFLCALLIAKNTEDTNCGIRSAGLISGAILTMIGIFTLPGKTTLPETGEVVKKKKHDFFFIPIIARGILLLIAGVYFAFIK